MIARTTGAQVTGVDLTPEFVSAAAELSRRSGLAERTSFEVASATDLPYDDGDFDAVTMLHVGMNIADKSVLMAELARVLRPGGMLAVYDIMQLREGDLVFPLPWATESSTSFVATPDEYSDAITNAGLTVTASTDRQALALEFIAAATAAPPPAVNPGDLMGVDWPTMFGNLVPLLQGGLVAPIEILARR